MRGMMRALQFTPMCVLCLPSAACLAVGRLLTAFPETCRPHLDRLYPLLFANLHDNIPSVRQGGAEALANAARAYGETALTLILDR